MSSLLFLSWIYYTLIRLGLLNLRLQRSVLARAHTLCYIVLIASSYASIWLHCNAPGIQLVPGGQMVVKNHVVIFSKSLHCLHMRTISLLEARLSHKVYTMCWHASAWAVPPESSCSPKHRCSIPVCACHESHDQPGHARDPAAKFFSFTTANHDFFAIKSSSPKNSVQGPRPMKHWGTAM